MMREPNSSRDTELGAVNNINSLLQEIDSDDQTQLSSASHFNPTSFHDDFLEQMLSSIHSSAASFPWADDQTESGVEGHLEDQSPELLASKMRQHQISNDADKALLLQQHLLLSRGLIAVNDLRSPTGADPGLVPVVPADHNDFVDPSAFKSANLANDASVKALFSGLTGSLDQTANLPQHLHHPQTQNHGTPFATAAASGTTGGAAAGPPKQRVRARRGQATDPHSIAERLRRERIAERMKSLQELVPNANKTDKTSMLDEIIDYVKFLRLQVKVLSMSRLGGAAAVSPLVADEGRSINGTQMASSSSIMNDGTTVVEHQVLKLMEEDMGSAMQYLQGKGLCLVPISLATAISTNNLNTSGATINPLQ